MQDVLLLCGHGTAALFLLPCNRLANVRVAAVCRQVHPAAVMAHFGVCGALPLCVFMTCVVCRQLEQYNVTDTSPLPLRPCVGPAIPPFTYVNYIQINLTTPTPPAQRHIMTVGVLSCAPHNKHLQSGLLHGAGPEPATFAFINCIGTLWF